MNEQEVGEPGKNNSSSKACPRCRLINPFSAQRCDCGYDFVSKKIEKPYFKQRIPKDIRIYFTLLIPLSIFLAFLGLTAGDYIRFISAVVWGIVCLWLYAQLLKKKNWARIALVIVTFPLGLILGLSTEAKLYCLQQD